MRQGITVRRVTLFSIIWLLVLNCRDFLITRSVPVSEIFTEYTIWVLSCSANLCIKYQYRTRQYSTVKNSRVSTVQ